MHQATVRISLVKERYLSGANWSEVVGMAEKYTPFLSNIFVKTFDRADGRFCFKVRRYTPQSQFLLLGLLLHRFPSLPLLEIVFWIRVLFIHNAMSGISSESFHDTEAIDTDRRYSSLSDAGVCPSHAST